MHIQGKASIHPKHGGGTLKLLILNIHTYIHIHTHIYIHESIVPLNNSMINHKTRFNILKYVTIILNISITNIGEGHTTNTITYAYYDVKIFQR